MAHLGKGQRKAGEPRGDTVLRALATREARITCAGGLWPQMANCAPVPVEFWPTVLNLVYPQPRGADHRLRAPRTFPAHLWRFYRIAQLARRACTTFAGVGSIADRAPGTIPMVLIDPACTTAPLARADVQLQDRLSWRLFHGPALVKSDVNIALRSRSRAMRHVTVGLCRAASILPLRPWAS